MRKEDILKTAIRTLEQRQEMYGSPFDGISMMAQMLSVYLDRMISPHDVCVIEIIQKICRLKKNNGLHDDSWVDIAGYAGIGSEVAHEDQTVEEFICKEFRMENTSP